MIKTEIFMLIGQKIGLHTNTIKSFFGNRIVPEQQQLEMTNAIDDLMNDYSEKLHALKLAKDLLIKH